MAPLQGRGDMSTQFLLFSKNISRERIKSQLSIDVKIIILSTKSILCVKINGAATVFRTSTLNISKMFTGWLERFVKDLQLEIFTNFLRHGIAYDPENHVRKYQDYCFICYNLPLIFLNLNLSQISRIVKSSKCLWLYLTSMHP